MAEMIERIEKVLEQDVRPSLLSHEGNVQIVSYEEKSKILRVRLTGQCSGCPSAQLTTEEVIEKAVKEKIPEVEQVMTGLPEKRVPDGTAHRSYGDRRQYGDRYKVLRRL